MLKRRHRNPFFQKVFTLIVFYLAVASFLPEIQALKGYTLSCFIASFSWVIYAALSKPYFFINKQINKHTILLFIMYTFLMPYISGNGTIGNRYLSYGQVFIFYLIYQYNHSYGYDNSSRFIIKWSLPFIVYTSIQTLSMLLSNPFLSRSLKGNGDEYSALIRLQGVGGYEFIYFLVFIVILLLFFIFNKKNLKYTFRMQISFYSLLLLFAGTAIYSNYFTGLTIIVVSFFTLIFLKKRSKVSRLVLAIAGILTLVQGKWIFMNITNSLMDLLGSGKTVERLISLQMNILGSGGGENLLGDRIATIVSSWDALLQNPLTGLITKKIAYDGDFLVGFGQHSQILDTFALYGLFIGLLNIYILIQPFIRGGRNSALSSLNFTMLVSSFLLFIMDNVTLSVGYAVFFIYPVVYDYLFERIELEKNRSEANKPIKYHNL